MDTGITANRLTDYAVAMAIVSNPIIHDEVSEDGWSGRFIPDLINEQWIYILANKKIIGCYRLEGINSICGQVHAFILPKYRKKYSMTSTKTMLDWYFSNLKKLNKIICYIPSKFKNVIKHAIKSGFAHEGTITEMYLKDEKIYDMEIFGIKRGGLWVH